MSTMTLRLNTFRSISLIILFVCSYALAGHVDPVMVSPSGRFIATGSQNGIRVSDTKNKVSTIKYGHPLGFTTPVLWTNDSVLIINTACCEAVWWFVTHWPSGKISYLTPKKNRNIYEFDRAIRTFISSNSADSLYGFILDNAYETAITSDSLLSGTRE